MKRAWVLVGHDQLLSPKNSSYSTFFRWLAAHRVDWEARADVSSLEETEGVDAIIVGAPLKLLSRRTCEALREFVGCGGTLLLTAQTGGDERPLGEPCYQTNMSDILPGLRFSPSVVYRESQMESNDNLGVYYPIPAWPHRLFHQRGSRDAEEAQEIDFSYVSGCTFFFDQRWFLPHAVVEAADACQGYDLSIKVAYHPEVEYDDLLTSEDADAARPLQGYVFAHLGFGDGQVFVLGGTSTLSNDVLGDEGLSWPRRQRGVPEGITDNRALLSGMLLAGLGLTPDEELLRRMQGPQRHRLLQGYPMLPVMKTPRYRFFLPSSIWSRERHKEKVPPLPVPGTHRPALVGILPHSYCNPTVQGCGFCTFPQEKMQRSKIPALAEQVLEEMAVYDEQRPDEASRATPAVYFGGATANLTPPDTFGAILDGLAQRFSCGAQPGEPPVEITLEGVPRYFQLHDYGLMKMLRDRFPDASLRISMGVQTLDEDRLASMGRTGFGGPRVFAEVVEMAHQLGFAASCDMLINLPEQTAAEIRADLEGVAAMGFDQICMYHLVLFEGLGTPWSEQAEMLDGLPSNQAAFRHWCHGRDRLLQLGFHQSTLTNFERAGGPVFRYEIMGYQPHEYDLVGFGPNAISLALNEAGWRGTKWVNPRLADDYLQMLSSPIPRKESHRKVFTYAPIDSQILYLTRSIARLGVEREEYQRRFGAALDAHFGWALEVALERGLLVQDGERLALTPQGMFYADALAGLLAWPRIPCHKLPDMPKRQEVVEAWPILPRAVVPMRFHDPNEAMWGSMG